MPKYTSTSALDTGSSIIPAGVPVELSAKQAAELQQAGITLTLVQETKADPKGDK